MERFVFKKNQKCVDEFASYTKVTKKKHQNK